MLKEIHTFELRLTSKIPNNADLPIFKTIYCSSERSFDSVLSHELRLAGLNSDLSQWNIQILSHDSFSV